MQDSDYRTAFEQSKRSLSEWHDADPLWIIASNAGSIKNACKYLRSGLSSDSQERFHLQKGSPILGPDDDTQTLLNYYGGLQRIVAIEEMAELIVELCRDMQDHGDIEHIAEELGDVTLMIEQMRRWYGIHHTALRCLISDKTERQLFRIEKEKKHGK